jgi:regulator of sirC expression with transglutaminase-like and TPR domain
MLALNREEMKAPWVEQAPTFEQLALQKDDDLDVALGAALIARDVYPEIDVAEVLGRIDELAGPIADARFGERSSHGQADGLAHHLYDACGFAGNEADYYDPKNSLLPDVLDRRLGIPISLALIYCEVAKRAGITARGVAFPGHFIVRIETPGEEALFVDPFFGGRALDYPGLRKILTRVTGDERPVLPQYLEAASPRGMLVRMLVNLRAIYLSRGDMARAMLAVDRVICLTPDAPEPLRERGLLSMRLGAMEAAKSDLERFLELVPDAQDAPAIRARLKELRAKPRATN